MVPRSAEIGTQVSFLLFLFPLRAQRLHFKTLKNIHPGSGD